MKDLNLIELTNLEKRYGKKDCITYWNSNNGKFRKYGFKPAERIWI